MTSGFELIVFDWDGTLMDSEARIVACLHAAITDLDLPERDREQLRNIIGLGLHEALVTLYPDEKTTQHQALTERYRHHFLVANQTPSLLFDGVEAMLKALADRGHLLAIATGKGRAGLDRVLSETGLGELFHATRCADEACSKPHPQMLDELMEVLGAEPSATLMIGDTEYDLQMAHNAGAQSLAVSYGVHHKSRLLACNPLACVDSIDALHDWLITDAETSSLSETA